MAYTIVPDQYQVNGEITSLDDFFTLTQPVNSISKAVTNTLYQVSNQGIQSIVPPSKDYYGLTFFTRPQLNLTTGNIRNNRKLIDYLTLNKYSTLRYARCLLDPRISSDPDDKGITCPLLDEKSPFIPIFTNTIKSMSGWPDPVLPLHTSDKGLRGEQYQQVDGVSDIYESFDITCTFKNIHNEPITQLLNLWVLYMGSIFEGVMVPYIDFIRENEIDYNTRIYRLILDETKTYVKKIACTGASVPSVNPMGRFFDYQDTELYNSQTKTIDIRFSSVGACYNDPIVAHEFNLASCIFNEQISNMYFNSNTGHTLDKVPPSMLNAFNYRCYPFINTLNMELEWWVDKNSKRYKKVMRYLNSMNNTNYRDATFMDVVTETKKELNWRDVEYY